MATVGKGSKRSVYATQSTGMLNQDFKSKSGWNPGKSKNKSFLKKKMSSKAKRP